MNGIGLFEFERPLGYRGSVLCIFLFICTNLFSQDVQTDFGHSKKEQAHVFYITANFGLAQKDSVEALFSEIVNRSQKDKKATLLVMGDFLSKKGYRKKGEARKRLNDSLERALLKPLEKFNGKIIYMPGKNEWNQNAPQSIDDLESFLQDNSKAKFWPNDGCSLEREEIGDHVVLVMVDSRWFLNDWDDYPQINEKCELKTREQFFAEFKDDLKDSQGKTVIVAVDQPIMSNTKISILNKMGGFTPGSYQNEQNRLLRGRLETIASQFEDVIFVSGKDRNLQYLEDDGIPQIISGAVGKTERARAQKDEDFVSEKNGYAKLTVFKDGSSVVDFFPVSGNVSNPIFSKKIKRERATLDEISYPQKKYGATEKASIYTAEETDKRGFYKWLWGDHYRNLYSKKIEAPVLWIDSLPQNVRPISEGGGTQSRSLRLIDDKEHEYTLRALRKSAVRFLQVNAVNDHYVEDYLKNTVAERYLLDFYTTSHPYAQFSVNELSETLDILHANPKIYYVPKQDGLGIFNEDYGNELYMLEEHVGDENKNFETFGKPDDIISTSDLLLELRESKESFVDEQAYIKARLFDMLVGNWDRHQDQWRWAQYKTKDGRKRYETIPRDWDQAFPKYDGPLIALLKYSFPILRKMQSYGADIKNIKWFNLSGYPLDKAFIKSATWNDWQRQVAFIQQNLTDKAIDAAFETLPEAAQESSIVTIKTNLKARRDALGHIAKSYYAYLNEFETVIGTEDDDDFLITRKADGLTEISVSKKDSILFKNNYSAKATDEIWIYGLNGKDNFKVVGKGKPKINIKVIGGNKNDIYDFENTKKVKLYDYQSEKTTILNPRSNKWLVDSYDINHYDYEKRKYDENVLFPSVGYDGDTGFRIGLKNRFRTYRLANNPFSKQHTVGAEYFFATNGFALEYNFEAAHIFYKWNFGLDLRYASPNFTMNYFGSGNGSVYDTETERDFNRVRIRQWKISPFLVHKNAGNTFNIRASLESNDVSDDDQRFVGEAFQPDNDVFQNQHYLSSEVSYRYLNKNDSWFPNRGMDFNFTAGYKTNIDGNDDRFGYLKPSLALMYPLHPSGIAVLATKIAGETILGNNYEFYHGAVLGGNQSLRGYRNERFNGKTAFHHSTDIRVGLTRFRTNFIPLQIGVSAGFDYGRIWSENDSSQKWHNNFGGSLWISGFSAFTGNLGFYQGKDGNRLLFSLGFSF